MIAVESQGPDPLFLFLPFYKIDGPGAKQHREAQGKDHHIQVLDQVVIAYPAVMEKEEYPQEDYHYEQDDHQKQPFF